MKNLLPILTVLGVISGDLVFGCRPDECACGAGSGGAQRCHGGTRHFSRTARNLCLAADAGQFRTCRGGLCT